MRNLLAAAFLFAPLHALAGTTITVSVGDVSETWTLSDTDQQKFEAWVQTAYTCVTAAPATTVSPPAQRQSPLPMPSPTPRQSPPAPAPQATGCTPLTLAESEALWAKATLQGTADNVTRFQNTVAATIAVNATAPIGFNVGPAKK